MEVLLQGSASIGEIRNSENFNNKGEVIMNKFMEIVKVVYLCIGLMFFAKEVVNSNNETLIEDLQNYGVSI